MIVVATIRQLGGEVAPGGREARALSRAALGGLGPGREPGLAAVRGLGVLGEPEHRLGQLVGDDRGQGHGLEHLADVRPQREPDLLERLRGAAVLDLLGALAADRGQRPLDRADDLRQRDLVRRRARASSRRRCRGGCGRARGRAARRGCSRESAAGSPARPRSPRPSPAAPPSRRSRRAPPSPAPHSRLWLRRASGGLNADGRPPKTYANICSSCEESTSSVSARIELTSPRLVRPFASLG